MRFLPLSGACLFACLLAASAQAEVHGGYGDATEYLHTDAQYEAWFQLGRALRRDFDWICGDTFCEGEYTNIQPLRYRCSVHLASGRIGMCTWTFAASHEEIAPATGRIGVQRAFWQCRTPLAPDTTIERLLEALAVEEPLYASLPGSRRTLMYGLIDCL